MNCIVCSKDSGKGKTCSSTCRSKLARTVATTVASTSVASPTVARSDKDTLRAWRDGEGSAYQRGLGELAKFYDCLTDDDFSVYTDVPRPVPEPLTI